MAGGGRYFCTAGRGMEPFVVRELRARLGATEVDYVSGKVFFTAEAELCDLRKLKSGERLFLLLKRHAPLLVSRNKGKALYEIKSLVTEEPGNWLDIISVWKNLHGHKEKKDNFSQENPLPLKRKTEDEVNIAAKRQKTDIVLEERQAGAEESCVVTKSNQDFGAESKTSKEETSKSSKEEVIDNEQHTFSFRVSCRCSGAIAKILTSQEIGRAIGIALMKQFGWRADLRNPDLEEWRVCSYLGHTFATKPGAKLFKFGHRDSSRVACFPLDFLVRDCIHKAPVGQLRAFSFWDTPYGTGAQALETIFVHLNDIHSVLGIPLFRIPLANREYIQTAGLRSTIAWAMASLAEISAGAFVLDPMCGLGTILLEAAKEWPEAFYWGTDISDSQLEGAYTNIRSAGLMDNIELLKASVKALPLPSESFDTVISDIPFGKKFKITEEVPYLPDILREMERVLRVGGTLVLLLSQDLRKDMDEMLKPVESDGSPKAVSDGAHETTTVKALDVNGNSSSVVTDVEESFLSSRQMCFGSLVPDGIYGVSLGKTDAFIYKYKKISPARSH